jgi:hypothetical protein
MRRIHNLGVVAVAAAAVWPGGALGAPAGLCGAPPAGAAAAPGPGFSQGLTPERMSRRSELRRSGVEVGKYVICGRPPPPPTWLIQGPVSAVCG